MSTPKPVAVSVICSVCGLDWHLHNEKRGKVDLSECVRLLKAELARRPNITTINKPSPCFPHLPQWGWDRWYSLDTTRLASTTTPEPVTMELDTDHITLS